MRVRFLNCREKVEDFILLRAQQNKLRAYQAAESD